MYPWAQGDQPEPTDSEAIANTFVASSTSSCPKSTLTLGGFATYDFATGDSYDVWSYLNSETITEYSDGYYALLQLTLDDDFFDGMANDGSLTYAMGREPVDDTSLEYGGYSVYISWNYDETDSQFEIDGLNMYFLTSSLTSLSGGASMVGDDLKYGVTFDKAVGDVISDGFTLDVFWYFPTQPIPVPATGESVSGEGDRWNQLDKIQAWASPDNTNFSLCTSAPVELLLSATNLISGIIAITFSATLAI